MIWFSIRAIALALILQADVSIFACSCSHTTVGEARANAAVIFQGKLLGIEYVDPPRPRTLRRFLATLEVSGVWKGNVGRTIVLHTREGSSDCIGFWTEPGIEVLVFANRTKVGRFKLGFFGPDWRDKVPRGHIIISPGICTLTDELKYAGETLKQLGPPKPPRSE